MAAVARSSWMTVTEQRTLLTKSLLIANLSLCRLTRFTSQPASHTQFTDRAQLGPSTHFLAAPRCEKFWPLFHLAKQRVQCNESHLAHFNACDRKGSVGD
jgi:hypothetical protein